MLHRRLLRHEQGNILMRHGDSNSNHSRRCDLSGGHKVKVVVIILFEPTNDLDHESLGAASGSSRRTRSSPTPTPWWRGSWPSARRATSAPRPSATRRATLSGRSTRPGRRCSPWLRLRNQRERLPCSACLCSSRSSCVCAAFLTYALAIASIPPLAAAGREGYYDLLHPSGHKAYAFSNQPDGVPIARLSPHRDLYRTLKPHHSPQSAAGRLRQLLSSSGK